MQHSETNRWCSDFFIRICVIQVLKRKNAHVSFPVGEDYNGGLTCIPVITLGLASALALGLHGEWTHWGGKLLQALLLGYTSGLLK